MTRHVDVAEILAHHTGGGDWWTREVSQRIGAPVTVVGQRRGWAPASVTFTAAGLSVATSVAVMVLGTGLPAAIVAGLGWQVAYGLDCSDGQLARATGRTSAVGAAIDLYGDWLARVALVTALFLALDDGELAVPLAVVALVTAGQLAGLFHEAVNQGGAGADLRRSRLLRVVGVARDPGLLFVVYAVALASGPAWVLGALAYGAAWGAVRFVVRYARLGRQAWRH